VNRIESQLTDVFVYVALVSLNDISAADVQYPILSVIYHPQYVVGDLTHDVAVLKVQSLQ
jgi:hypothetical protein